MSNKSLPVLPLGPICSYGNRLTFTYFNSTSSTSNSTPTPEYLNSNYSKFILGAIPNSSASGNNIIGGTHWFTIDDQLLYLSFFQDSGPLNAACL